MTVDPEAVPAVDTELFAHAREKRLDAKHQLAQALIGAGATDDDEAVVDLVLDDAALDQLAERVIGKLADAAEPPAGFLDAVAGDAEDQRQVLVNAVLGRRDDVAGDGPLPSSGFDGGARPGLLRRPESHDDLIVRLVLRSRAGGG